MVVRTCPQARDDLSLELFGIQRDPNRVNHLFDDAADDEVFNLLVGFFYGGLSDALRETAEAQTWAKHNLTLVVCEVSNYMFLVDGRVPRLLIGNKRLEWVVKPCVDFDSQLSACRQRLDEKRL